MWQHRVYLWDLTTQQCICVSEPSLSCVFYFPFWKYFLMLLTIKWALPSSQESSKLAFWVYWTPSDVDLHFLFSLSFHSTTIAFLRAWLIRCIMVHWKCCGSRRFLNWHTAGHSLFFRGINSQFLKKKKCLILKKKKVLKRQNGRLELAGKGVAALSCISPELTFRCVNSKTQ